MKLFLFKLLCLLPLLSLANLVPLEDSSSPKEVSCIVAPIVVTKQFSSLGHITHTHTLLALFIRMKKSKPGIQTSSVSIFRQNVIQDTRSRLVSRYMPLHLLIHLCSIVELHIRNGSNTVRSSLCRLYRL
jgi:hypothetical protein